MQISNTVVQQSHISIEITEKLGQSEFRKNVHELLTKRGYTSILKQDKYNSHSLQQLLNLQNRIKEDNLLLIRNDGIDEFSISNLKYAKTVTGESNVNEENRFLNSIINLEKSAEYVTTQEEIDSQNFFMSYMNYQNINNLTQKENNKIKNSRLGKLIISSHSTFEERLRRLVMGYYNEYETYFTKQNELSIGVIVDKDTKQKFAISIYGIVEITKNVRIKNGYYESTSVTEKDTSTNISVFQKVLCAKYAKLLLHLERDEWEQK